ncbi:MAG TPA: hypothetical protein VKA70_10535 [Blastocatellia bacterium]|nr:hypothetical protein [Blastocatellia bacterium]
MAQAITETTCPCPLCGEELSLDINYDRVAAKWRDLFAHRDRWRDASESFTLTRSVDAAAVRLSLPADVTKRILEFLCLELCGCRRVTCVSCLDDFRSEL